MITDFNDVLSYLNDIPNINEGGCAIAALAMYKWLEENDELAYDTCVVYLMDEEEAEINNKAYEAFPRHSNIKACIHALLQHNGNRFDCTGGNVLHRRHEDELEIEDMDFLVASINSDNWNIMFNREYVSDIEQNLSIDLSNIRRA
jgi:hypothetical protein